MLIKLSADTQQYLQEVWEYDSVEEMDSFTAAMILDNVRQNNPEWTADAELFEAYLRLHADIPNDISHEDFLNRYCGTK